MINYSKKNTILINCISMRSGGGISILRNLITKIYKQRTQDIDIKILITQDQFLIFKEFKRKDIIIIKNPGNGINKIIWMFLNLKKIAKEYNIQTIFTPSQMTPIINGVNNIIMFTNLEPFKFHRYKYSFNLYLRNILARIYSIYSLKKAHKIIAVSDYAKDFLINQLRINQDKLFRVYHGYPDLNSIKDNKLIDNIQPYKYIFTCGSILPYRRLEDVIYGYYHSLNQLSTTTKLVIAGDEIDKNYALRIRKLIKDLNISDKVLMLGKIKWHDILNLYRHSKLLVLSSEIETFCIIAIEAMACGCNIIAAKNDPFPEVLKNTAFYYESRNSLQLSVLMKKVLNNYSQDILNLDAIKRSKYFSWNKSSNEIFKILTT